MSNQNNFNIKTYEDLKIAKQQLKYDIIDQESAIINNPLIRISSSIFGGDSFKSSFTNSVESISLENYKRAAENILSTILMANKKTRKYFIAFIIAKEMIPFTLKKINEVLKK
jgi:hypothetical protein